MAKTQMQEKRELLNMLTKEDIISFFADQMEFDQEYMVKTEGNLTFDQLARYADDCSKSVTKLVMQCKTANDFAQLSANLTNRLSPGSQDYLNALKY